MSTQAGSDITFAVASDQEHFRLMELPAEVVSLLASSEPPVLHFKSSSGGNTVLCLPDKTFNFRQVHTSNSVHIVRPEAEQNDPSDLLQQQRLVSISQCGSTLEIEGTSTESALSYLRTTLPVYHGVADGNSASSDKVTKGQIFDDVPLSDAEITKAWKELCAFESDEGLSCFQPSARALVQAWSSISSVALIEKIKLDQTITETSIRAIIEAAEDAPHSLLEAVFQNLLTPSDGKHQLDKERTIVFVGRSLIQDLVEVSESDFMRQWQNLLPEAWRVDADFELLAGLYRKSQNSGETLLHATNADPGASASKMAPSNAKRKWHEKFKQARNR